MATKTATTTYVPTPAKSGMSVVWAALANGDDGAPVELFDWTDVSVQFTGTFGSGGSVRVEGCADEGDTPTNWSLLGAAVTAAGIVQLAVRPRFVRVRVTAGDGTTAIVAKLYARRARIN